MRSTTSRHPRRSRFGISEVITTLKEHPGSEPIIETGWVVWDKATGHVTSPVYESATSAEIARKRLESGASEEELHLP